MRKPVPWGAGLVLMCSVVAVAGAGLVRAQGEPSGRSWLGVYTQSLTRELRDGLGYDGEGVLVNRVVSRSPADRAGLEKGDVIVSVNSRRVETPEELQEVISSARAGQSVGLSIWRDGARRTLTARLAARPGEEGEIMPEARRGPQSFDPNQEIPEPPITPVPPRMERDEHGDLRVELPRRSMILGNLSGRGRLGVRVDDLNADMGDVLGVPEGRGALVMEVLQDTPAARAGLKAGDVIVRFGNRAIDDSDDLLRALREAEEGRSSITAVRRGTKRTFTVDLPAAPRAYRLESGRGMMGLGDLGDRDDMRQELQQLREEVRELREKIEKLEHH